MTRLVKGIILRKQDYRESDRLFVIYTDELGKIEAVAKGVRKIKSKMAGHLELFSVINLMVAPGRSYYQIAGADAINNFSNIKKDLAKIVLSGFCLEAMNIFTRNGQPDFKIYELLLNIFKIFNDEKNKDFFKVYILSKFFTLKLLSISGWTPELYTCTKCKRKIVPNGNYFDAGHGGLVCSQCGKNNFPISTATIKILRFVLKENLGKAATLNISKNNIKEIARIIDEFLFIHQDREIKSGMWITNLTKILKI